MFRFIRIAWLMIFLIPLVPLAGRFCNLLPTDAIYHSLVFLHEQLPLIIAAFVTASAIATLIKLARVRGRIQSLLALASPLPGRIQVIAWREAQMLRMRLPQIVYLDVPEPLCFASIGGPLVFLSRGFVEALSDDDLTLILRHEMTHVRHRDPLRGVLVHLAFGALLVPGFEAIERALYLMRESHADAVAAQYGPEKYDSLLARLSSASKQEASICRGVTFDSSALLRTGDAARGPVAWMRLLPAGAAAALIVGVFTSHAFFDDHLNYLLTHHC